MRYGFHFEAEQELQEVPGLGFRFGDDIHRVMRVLLDQPELGQ